MVMIVVKLVTSKVGVKHELLFNEPTSGLLNKISSSAAALSVAKFVNKHRYDFDHTLLCCLKAQLHLLFKRKIEALLN
jgi:hypothetical protein